MGNSDTGLLRQAGKLFRKAIYNPKIPVKTLRVHFDALLGEAILPHNMDLQTVDAGVIPADLLSPELAIGKRIILYAHGGGFISGSRKAYRSLCASLATECAARLLLPEYRLSPEYPFPTALEDLYNAYAWLLKQGNNPADIIVAGDGAGGNLALSLLHYLSDKGSPLPAAAILLSPWTDLACEGQAFLARKHPDPIHTKEILSALALQYTWQSNFKNPQVSPIHGDFSLFPPLYIQCGSKEILLDDSRALAERARAVGIPTVLDIEDGMWHLFQAIDRLTPRAHLAVKRIGAWARSGCAGGLR
ncbi:alpha/beta hydrolase [Treponema zuelzerae]|uniref:Alpha/beta hydrolase n=1 Tax=Teretinema zuelzerae TaxID=156 RepID=A0AAE3EJ29_9SPIR|nr:alpha/beta hydrolase [Teretinema zuelzerae]MCD1655644.1 alpha/beta hydrolase [Teretinema zuelzerae]